MLPRRLIRDAAKECYLDVEKQLHAVCYKFWKHYGGDLSDYESEALEHFMNIFLTHNPERGEFRKDISFRVWHRLLETKEKEANRKRILPRVELHENIGACSPEPFDFEEFLINLDDDAIKVVQTVFSSPPEIELSLVQYGEPSPNNIRRALREYLKDLGWDSARISSSFAEIRRALT